MEQTKHSVSVSLCPCSVSLLFACILTQTRAHFVVWISERVRGANCFLRYIANIRSSEQVSRGYCQGVCLNETKEKSKLTTLYTHTNAKHANEEKNSCLMYMLGLQLADNLVRVTTVLPVIFHSFPLLESTLWSVRLSLCLSSFLSWWPINITSIKHTCAHLCPVDFEFCVFIWRCYRQPRQRNSSLANTSSSWLSICLLLT